MSGSGTVRLGFRPALVGKNDVPTTQSFVHLVYVPALDRPNALLPSLRRRHALTASDQFFPDR